MRSLLLALLLVLTACTSWAPPPALQPSTSAPTPTRLGLITDFGTCDEGEQWAVDLMDEWRVDAIVTAGDNTQNEEGCVPYSESVWGYLDAGSDGRGNPPVWPTLGNHDYTDAGAGLDAYRQAFPYLSKAADPQQRWYTQVVGNVILYVLDSESTPDELDAQRVWLQQTLAEQRAAHPDVWNVVLFHSPAYTSGVHEDNRAMRPTHGWDYKGWGADIVVSGHQHIYEDVVVDDFHYVTAGLGGTANFRDCPVERREGSRLCRDGTGASLITATPERFVLEYHQPASGTDTRRDVITLER